MSDNRGRYHEAVGGFKRQLLCDTLKAYDGNRTHAARALGLQRTYLLRLIRNLHISVPISRRGRCRNDNGE